MSSYAQVTKRYTAFNLLSAARSISQLPTEVGMIIMSFLFSREAVMIIGGHHLEQLPFYKGSDRFHYRSPRVDAKGRIYHELFWYWNQWNVRSTISPLDLHLLPNCMSVLWKLAGRWSKDFRRPREVESCVRKPSCAVIHDCVSFPSFSETCINNKVSHHRSPKKNIKSRRLQKIRTKAIRDERLSKVDRSARLLHNEESEYDNEGWISVCPCGCCHIHSIYCSYYD